MAEPSTRRLRREGDRGARRASGWRTQLDDGEPRRPGRVPPEPVSGVGPVRAQARLGRLRGRLPLSAESLWDLPSRTGRWSVDGSHERLAVRFRISDRRASEAEAHGVRGTLGRCGEPRLPQGPDGRLEDDEQRQSVATFHHGFARPGRVPRGSPGRNGRRCRGSDRCIRRDEHGAALCEPRRGRIVEDDQRLPPAHLLRDRGNRTVAGTRLWLGERRKWKEAAQAAPPRGRSRTQKTKIRTRTAASSCAIRQTVVVQESPEAAYAPRKRASVTKKPPMPRRIRAAMMIDVAPPPPPATARIDVATIPVRSASRPNTKTVMCWAGDRPMSQSLSPIPAIVPPHPKIVGEFARTSSRATNATIRRKSRTKTSRSSA